MSAGADVSCWAVHSSIDEQPVFRAACKTQREAEKKLAELQREDAEPRATYWVAPLTASQVENFKRAGVLSSDF